MPDTCLLLLVTEVQRRQPLVWRLPTLSQPRPLQLKWLPRDLRGWFPPPFHVSFFPFWVPDIKDQDLQKQPDIQGKLEPDHEKVSKKTQEVITRTPQADPQHKTAYNYSKTNNNNKKANPGEGGESDLQSYHTTRFKCPMFNKKITRHAKKRESIAQ